MLSYTLERIPIAMSMAVSLTAVIERNTKDRQAVFNRQATLPSSDQQTESCLLVFFSKRARGQRLLSIFIEATSLISWQYDTGPSVYGCGLDAVIVRIITWKGALFSRQRIKVPSFVCSWNSKSLQYSLAWWVCGWAKLAFFCFVLYPRYVQGCFCNSCHRLCHKINKRFLT